MKAKMARTARPEPEIRLATANARIAWVLNHPDTSSWLKAALRSARDVNPIEIQNDIEILRHLITERANAEGDLALSQGHVD